MDEERESQEDGSWEGNEDLDDLRVGSLEIDCE